MKHYDFAAKFHGLYDLAVARFAHGTRGPANLISAEEIAFLTANGLTAQHLYDYAEDHNNYGEPGFDIALSIEVIRRDYFLNVQSGRASSTVLDEGQLPPKAEAIRDIAWLPRLLPKARAKLRGELPASLMYCCGGDRAFFQRHDVQPGEFLNLVWRHERDDAAVVEWVVRRSQASG